MKKTNVTIYCPTYNQEKYIGQAIEGFVMQKASFPFEILIHDDCSTDRTKEIIEKYREKYPEIIKPIYASTNKFSKNIDILKDTVFPLVESDYIAICDGDDFWTDEYKLQKQFDALEQNPNCSISVHRVNGCDKDGSPNSYQRPSDKFGVLNTSRVIKQKEVAEMIFVLGSGTALPFQTSSYFIRTDGFKEHYSTKWMENGRYDSQFLRSCLAFGDFYYINETMSTYRYGSIGSIDTAARNKDKSIVVEQFLKNAYDDMNFDRFTDYIFHEQIMYEIYSIIAYSIEYNHDLSRKFFNENRLSLSQMMKFIGTKKTLRYLFIKQFPGLFKKAKNSNL